MATRKTQASHDLAPTAKRTTCLTTADPFEPPCDGAGLFKRLPDDVILFSIVSLLSFSASVALERCNKRLRAILMRNKRARCDAWLVRDVLGFSKDACLPVLAELASVGKAEGNLRVFYFSSAEGGDPAFLQEAASLAAAVVALAERDLSTEKDGSLETLEQTPYGKGYWVGDSDDEEEEEDNEDKQEEGSTAPKCGPDTPRTTHHTLHTHSIPIFYTTHDIHGHCAHLVKNWSEACLHLLRTCHHHARSSPRGGALQAAHRRSLRDQRRVSPRGAAQGVGRAR